MRARNALRLSFFIFILVRHVAVHARKYDSRKGSLFFSRLYLHDEYVLAILE